MQEKASNGIGICGCLFLIFLTLKLAEVGVVAKWSWIWIFSPFWIPFVFVTVLAMIVMPIVAVGEWLSRRKNMKAVSND